MSEKRDNQASLASIANTAMEGGRTALSAATTGARTGARLAVGTFFAGCNLLLDLGVTAARHLPLDGAQHRANEIGDGTLPTATPVPPMGWWEADGATPSVDEAAIADAVNDLSRSVQIVGHGGRIALASGGRCVLSQSWQPTDEAERWYPLLAYAPALLPQRLGDRAFCREYGLQYAYVTGAMANGIGSEEIVEAMSRAGMLGFFGAAGLSPLRVEQAITRLQGSLGDAPHGFNLIHSPNEPDLENAIVELYLRRNVRLVEASAYLDLTLPLVRYRVRGIARDSDGRVVCVNKIIAKVSRPEVARKFMAPPPESLLAQLVQAKEITAEQAAMCQEIPVATDLTIEADSGGHTDNRPSIALIPAMIALRDQMQAKYGYATPLRIGAAGGIATPASAAAAFAMGAAYIVTGSVNQACVEAGTSPMVREMLAQAGQADVIMAPAADMFEMGVKVQVLKWGTMFATRGRKLYELYRAHGGIAELPAKERTILERDYFRCTLEEAWAETRRFFETRDPKQIARAEADPKHQMALVFRSYLGRSSDWANKGDASRKVDYQIWCGPAMGAFNEWTKGTFLEAPSERKVATVAMNLMYGAAVMTRVHSLRTQGISLPAAAEAIGPRPLAEINRLIGVATKV